TSSLPELSNLSTHSPLQSANLTSASASRDTLRCAASSSIPAPTGTRQRFEWLHHDGQMRLLDLVGPETDNICAGEHHRPKPTLLTEHAPVMLGRQRRFTLTPQTNGVGIKAR